MKTDDDALLNSVSGGGFDNESRRGMDAHVDGGRKESADGGRWNNKMRVVVSIMTTNHKSWSFCSVLGSVEHSCIRTN